VTDTAGERRDEGAEATVAARAAADRELMTRVQTGDEAALGGLMERWELPVKGLIARLVLNASEAEELAQETFVRVWQQFAIAVNLARNRLRWWRRRPEVSLEAWNETEDRGGRTDDEGRTGGAAGLEQAERAAAVREEIAALPVELREAIVLFEYEDLSHAEIGAAVGATPKAVETRIYRAREKLRATLRHWV
jgi:RNA polymerase sigma-70 factor (ECF subfamily)